MQTLRLNQIHPSPRNPRTRLDEQALAELTDSVSRHGILQPVLVRPSEAVGWEYELVCGHRRYFAAKAAGLAEIPVSIRELTDAEALEVQVIENLQRADLHPLDEAEGYRTLVETHGYAVPDLAAKMGKSRAHVYQRMQLARLPEAAKELLWKGEMNASLALLVARIPDAKLQAAAAKRIQEGHRDWDGGDGPGWVPMSLRAATEMIEHDFMLEMKNAPFNALDADLVPEAGACNTCPKMTGNSPDLFGDIPKANLCADPPCFAAKREAAWLAVASERRAKLGASRKVTVLTIKQSEIALPFSDGTPRGTNWVSPDAKIEGDRKGRTWRAAVVERAVPLPPAYLARVSKTGKAVELWKASDADAAIGKKKAAAGDAAGQSESSGPPARDWELENEIDRILGPAIERQLADKAREMDADQVLVAIVRSLRDHDFKRHAAESGVKAASWKKASPEDVRAIAVMAFNNGAVEDVTKAFGLDYEALEKAAREQVLAAREAAKTKSAAKPATAKAKPARAKKGGGR